MCLVGADANHGQNLVVGQATNNGRSKPIADAARQERVWNEVSALKDRYEMKK